MLSLKQGSFGPQSLSWVRMEGHRTKLVPYTPPLVYLCPLDITKCLPIYRLQCNTSIPSFQIFSPVALLKSLFLNCSEIRDHTCIL